MLKWISALFDRSKEYDTLGELVMENRRWRMFAKVGFTILTLMPILTYCSWIAPRFEDSGVTNPAVLEVINSEEYQQATQEIFALLDLYNRGEIGLDSLHGLQGVHRIGGVMVTFNLKLVPRDEPRQGGGSKYKLDGQYKVTVAIGYLVLFLTIELLLIGIATCAIFQGPPKAQRRLEEQILQDHFSLDTPVLPATVEQADQIIERMLLRFHRFAKDLEHRPRSRKGIQLDDEYDVQFLVNALLRLQFDNVKPEEPSPSMAAGATRADFLLPEHGLFLELKMTRDGMTARSLADELILDIARYRAHPECHAIIFFVYDPRGLVKNSVALQTELSEIAGELPVSLIVSPSH
ncbi:hypothetical protein ACT4MW_26595 [Pseudomonas brassicacearum subsp. neoaurantiaca]|uniref:PD-(D/E)XK nuclease domain-containing protein n=1 Tax=Pseudomonas brassicacearum TaxID=930166 RepID=UPI000F4820A3|nr:hypothetical protein [Pseudomonas brassicacearum]